MFLFSRLVRVDELGQRAVRGSAEVSLKVLGGFQVDHFGSSALSQG